MQFEYVIIQAGGKGTRLQHLTANKPKGIVPVNNLPMIFHLFNKYKDKKFIIICDYLHEVLEKYLAVFSPVKYECVVASVKGTCAGIKEAIDLIPNNESLMISWSDLIFDEQFDEKVVVGNAIGTPIDFECRWSFVNRELKEERSVEHGVAGVFFLKENGIRYNQIIFNAPYGERIVINDDKPSGLHMCRAIMVKRDSNYFLDESICIDGLL